MEYVRLCPTTAGLGEARLVIGRLAVGGALTIVLTDDVLLAGCGSVTLLVTVAVFPTAPPAVGVTTIVTVAAPPDASVPTLHVTVPEASEQVPCVDEAEPKFSVAG